MKTRVMTWLISFLLISAISACSPKESNEPHPSSSPKAEQSNKKKWEPVSRAYRIQGKIANVVVQDGQLRSISLHVTKNLVNSNPVDYDFVGQTIEVQFEDAPLDANRLNRLKKETEIAISIAQYALPDGKVVWGALPEWVYLVVDGSYEDLQGQPVKELRP
ncbi:hypothetical protein [Effusibacillus pohliae]|uniref:hypothetical protein n=1 Tax=Effusibacillus pohliae TaxID=232270 RepID=UPI00035FECB8|nr:hypothetical protein [Effusibacillus pohliae]